MTSPIPGISMAGFLGATGAVSPTSGVGAAQGASSAGGTDFANVLASSLDQLQGAQATADHLATQAATGDLKDVHDYMIASNEASLATEMVVTIKNKAVEAFNEIMRMPV